jgi:carboxymethylenebutenolidase
MSEALPDRGWAPGYLTVPSAGEGPGVVVLQDWWGVDGQVRAVVDRLAAEGFAAFAPDLYEGRVTADPDEAARLARHLESGGLPRELLEAVEVVRALPGVAPAPVAVVGLGLGGALALYLASLEPEVGAVVCYDGMPPPSAPFEWAGVRAAVLGHACEREFQRAGELQADLRRSGVAATFYLYPGTLHGFPDATRPACHHRAAAVLSWQRTVRFLGERSTAVPTIGRPMGTGSPPPRPEGTSAA